MLRNKSSKLVRLGFALLVLSAFAWPSDEGFRPGAEYPALSPDGNTLIFVSNVSGDRDIWIAGADGGKATPLINWPSSDEKQPSWSPDGTHIAFSSNRNSAKHQIWVVNSDGSNAIQLTLDNFEHEQPRYSPDGLSILFLSNRTGKRELWMMKSDGSNPHAIALISTRITDPAWSPSGKQIVYVGCTRGAACNLFQINSDGSGGRQITNGDFQDWTPDWASPGIIFASNRGGTQGLWLVQGDGSGLLQITAPDGAGDLDPRFQLGAVGFVFTRSGVNANDAASDVWSAPSIGAAPQRLTKIPVDSTPPVITPTVTGTLGQNGWYVSNVAVSWNVTDPESGIASTSGCDSLTLLQDTPGIVLTCSAVNGVGLTSSVNVSIKIDKTPPVILGMPASGCTLWPPNHKLVPIVTVTAADAGPSGLAEFDVTANSSESSLTSQPDVVITGSGLQPKAVQLRAERDGNGPGRTYTIKAMATDAAGNTSTAELTCIVPHDQGS
jgi:WD40 repeat protein